MGEIFGKEAIDKITGFKGIIVGKCSYIFGCDQYALAPKVNEKGERLSLEWFDEGRIQITGPGITAAEVKADKNGCETREHPSNH